jgi:hypothetical protein
MSSEPIIEPKVFVGSSKEAEEIARGFCRALKDIAIIVPWWDAHFIPMQSTLDGLFNAATEYDFGLFILTPDDFIQSRGEESNSPRDNVLFELGLFLGKLGPKRAFAVIQWDSDREKRVKVLSDLYGIYIPRFTTDDSIDDGIKGAVDRISSVITEQGRKPRKLQLVEWWNHDGTIFAVSLSEGKLEANRAELQGKRLAVVVTQRNPLIRPENDTRISRSNAEEPFGAFTSDLRLAALTQGVFPNLTPEDVIQGHLLLIPRGVNIVNAITIKQMIDWGCDLLETVGTKAFTSPDSFISR